ncbi:IclR family transcriptional regulator C-terminal domain-containing protein [Streptomyces sp. NPDC046977]|uniref:IclR family transcriptional regulator n=1 Tax=Streptomyces sp. NPDC046977 TaxID=3154703 RepID=UPI0033DE9805
MTTFGPPAAKGVGQVLQEWSRILDCFSVETPYLHTSDIVRMAGVPSSTVADMLPALVDQDLLRRDGPFYRVGLRMIRWGASADAASELVTVARSSLPALRDRTGEGCGLQIRRGSMHVTAFWAHSPQAFAYPGYVGRVQPLRGSAAGGIFMAHDAHALRLAGEGGPRTLEGSLERIRRRGWTSVDDPRFPGMGTLAAPVFDANGAVAAAVTLAGRIQKLTTDRVEELAAQVMGYALGISRYLSACG